jgi:hypothetical protein
MTALNEFRWRGMDLAPYVANHNGGARAFGLAQLGVGRWKARGLGAAWSSSPEPEIRD